MINKRSKECVTGYKEVGNLGGAASKAAHIETGGHMINKRGKEGITDSFTFSSFSFSQGLYFFTARI